MSPSQATTYLPKYIEMLTYDLGGPSCTAAQLRIRAGHYIATAPGSASTEPIQMSWVYATGMVGRNIEVGDKEECLVK